MGKSVLLGSVTALELKLKMQQPNVTGKSVQPAPNQALNLTPRQLRRLVPSVRFAHSGAG